ncbi:RNA polymerase sigma-70 factor (ECF subfamily) [Sphingomonas sp. PP-CE-3G-477]|uniref:sigma-70 family RNA polymerase sigma factor n=1 Tax=Sphingomonas sp. PP-CE-3G-477 TaxID=2135660 RepID=UPI000D3BED28|nr:sigma-70 family RNA polymerase sigma factor [Sphingomonas sp. PP-CE-3G-477]PTQ63842.1 RNA polymerase sigma-70 factor (ECF subfamily) [Sphingomonas sp. PP-CE-3G-477]
MDSSGLEAVFIANRDTLLRFIRSLGASDAEDLVQELWVRIQTAPTAPTGPIAAPLSYLYRMANNLMLDRHRAVRQAEKRDREWTEATGGPSLDRSEEPSAERVVIAREQAALAESALQSVGDRAARIFRRHRIDGVEQRVVAAEFGVSLSTVEGDLRKAYRAMIDAKRRYDEA